MYRAQWFTITDTSFYFTQIPDKVTEFSELNQILNWENSNNCDMMIRLYSSYSVPDATLMFESPAQVTEINTWAGSLWRCRALLPAQQVG